MSEPLSFDRAYRARCGHVVVGWHRVPCGTGFHVRARLLINGRVVEHSYTDDGRWSAGGLRSELDLVEVPPPERALPTP